MKQMLIVFVYTLKEGIRKKAFWISTIIIMAAVLLLCAVPRVFTAFTGEKSTEKADHEKKGTCYLLDEVGIFQQNLEMFQELYPELDFQIAENENLETLKQEIKEKEDDSLIYIEKTDGQPVVHVVNANFMKGISAKNTAAVCDQIMQSQSLRELGVGERQIKVIQTPLSYTEEYAGEMDITGYILGVFMTIVMFFAVYYYGNGVAMSVAAEKTSRVMETLIVSAKPSRILAGKCLGMGVVGLLQLGGLLVFGGLCYKYLLPNDVQLGGIQLSGISVSAGTVILLLVYFILGYALYAVLNSVCGAAVSRIEDLNAALLPVSIVAILGFYLGYFTSIAGGGSSTLTALALYLPISSPFAVPFKLLTGEIEPVQIGVSLAVLAVTIVVAAAIASKIYSISVMHYGKPLKLKDMKKMK